jgi:predicted nuclease of predicted toxin-antitoxin system
VRGYLLDENLPGRLPLPSGQPVYHARDLGARLTDSELWALAQREHWAIVSKDADFAERIVIASPPPWVIHLRFGNLRLAEFRSFVARAWPQVEALLPAHKLINVYQDRIEAVSGE